MTQHSRIDKSLTAGCAQNVHDGLSTANQTPTIALSRKFSDSIYGFPAPHGTQLTQILTSTTDRLGIISIAQSSDEGSPEKHHQQNYLWQHINSTI